MPRVGFEWDAAKDIANRAKHGVAFAEAQYAFADPQRVVAADLAHGGGVMTVRFTYRGNTIRIFGAGYWRKGKRTYEKANSLPR